MKTTKKHFEIFKKECRYWIQRFGLMDWEVVYEHKFIKDDDNVYADCSGDLEARLVVIRLNTEWGERKTTAENVKFSARHEALELLTMRFYCLARSRFIKQNDLGEVNHEIIRRLENAFFEDAGCA